MKIRDWYFQGWERRANDAGKTEFVYTGEYYSFPDGAVPARRAALCSLAALLALYLLLALQPSPGGMWHFAAIPQLLEIIPLIYLVMGAVCLIKAKQPMTFRDYYASWRRMGTAAWWSVGFTGLMAAVEVAYFFAADSLRLWSEIAYLLGGLACAALSAWLAAYIKKHPCVPSVRRTEKE